MSYNALFANSFKYGMMFGKDIKPGEPVSVSVTNVDDVLLAVRKAYIDMSPRTFKSNDAEHKQDLDSKLKEDLFLQLAQEIASYMENGTDDFDVWHHQLCKFFMDEFAKILKEADKKSENATYGKAQKIINMTFKYLYCFDDADTYSERFNPCHMALDSYILNWVRDQYNEGKPKQEWFTKSGKRQLPNWSSLEYTSGDPNKPQYKEIQQKIREKLSPTPPIVAEFKIWYDERKKVEEKENHA